MIAHIDNTMLERIVESAGLEDLFGHPIDLIEIGQVRNPVVRASLERNRVPIYAAA